MVAAVTSPTPPPDAVCPSLDVDPYDEEVVADPFPMADIIRRAGPVVYLSRYGVWAVARYQQVHDVLHDHQRFSSAGGVGLADARQPGYWRRPSILLEIDPPLHTRNRAVVSRTLLPKALRQLRATFDAEAAALADSLVARRCFDAVGDMAEVFPTRVFPQAFGLSAGGKRQLLAYGAMVFNGHGPRNRLFETSMVDSEAVVAWIAEQCSRRSLRSGSIGAQVYEAVHQGQVTETEAGLLVRSFLSAGVDTTVGALAYTALDFARWPDQWQVVRRDPSLAGAAFEEVVRLESPVVGFYRTTTAPVELAGVAIPADAKVLVLFAGANRDPDRWEHPDDLMVGRRTAGHLGYGAGIHNCVGQVVARMEGTAMIRALAERVDSWHIEGPPVARLNNTLRGLDHLPVRVEPA